MREVPTLPPGYRYSRDGRRIHIRYPKTEQVNQTLPGYWLKDEKAALAAWQHYNTAIGFTTCPNCGHAWNAHSTWIGHKLMVCEESPYND